MGPQGIVTVFAVDEDTVVIEDNGVGIAAENLGRVCDPFFSTKPEGSGTGLGLSVTQGIIDAHGGTLTLQSEVGRGTRVSIRLPHGGA